MSNACNHVIIFVLNLHVYLPDFNCFYYVVVIDLHNCAYVRIC